MKSPPPLELDVRPLLAAGTPPLAAILDAVKRLQPGQPLRLITPAGPEPMFDLLGENGLTALFYPRKDGAWECLVSPPDSEPPNPKQ